MAGGRGRGWDGGGGQNRFSKNLLFKRFKAKFFLSFKEILQWSKMDSVELNLMHYFIKNLI